MCNYKHNFYEIQLNISYCNCILSKRQIMEEPRTSRSKA